MTPFLALATMAGGTRPMELNWISVAPGIWRAHVGKSDLPTLLTAAHAVPHVDGLPKADAPFELSAAAGEVSNEFTSVRIPLGEDERLFGLGMQMHGSDRRGEVFHLRVDHYAQGKDRLHAPVPLYVSSKGYAVFFDTSRPISIYAGVGNRRDAHNPQERDRNTDSHWDAQPPADAVEASVQGPGLDVYLFAGPSPKQAVERYNLYCGGGTLPPRWALGFWHRTPSLDTAKDVESEVAEFKKRGFPIDVLGLEPGWQSKSYPCTFDWSKERFPDPAGFVGRLKSQNVHVNLWSNPYVSEDSLIRKALEPNYGSHMVWLGPAPDLMVPSAAKTIGDFFTKTHLDIGVSGYKIDEIDGFDNWLWPDHATFPSGLSGLRMRQIYGLLWQRELDEIYRKANRRTFGLVRGSNGGASRFPFALYSDTYDHREYITGMVNTGLAGVLWCAEARDAANGEEWVRRMQTAAVSHIAQLNAWASGTKPWSFPGYEEVVKSAMLFRTRLVPYLYTAYAHYHYSGTPVISPMALVDGGSETDQYLLGNDLLVAPMLTGQKSRKVRLPKGIWFDFDSGERIAGNQTIEIKPALDKIPVYVREGAVVPVLGGDVTNSTLTKDSELQIRHYGTGPASSLLYEDDGETFGYEKGQSAWRKLSWMDGKGTISTEKGAYPTAFQNVIWKQIG